MISVKAVEFIKEHENAKLHSIAQYILVRACNVIHFDTLTLRYLHSEYNPPGFRTKTNDVS